MDLGAPVIADEQALELMQPGEGALDDPTGAAEAGAVLGLATGDLRLDPAAPQLVPIRIVVIAAVGGDPLGPAAWAAAATTDGRNPLEERDQLGDIVPVAASERPGERDPGRVDQEVMLRAGSGSINRAWARRGAPFFACT